MVPGNLTELGWTAPIKYHTLGLQSDPGYFEAYSGLIWGRLASRIWKSWVGVGVGAEMPFSRRFATLSRHDFVN